MTEREAGGSGPLPLRKIDEMAMRSGPVVLTIEDVVLLVLRADPRPVTGAGRLTGLVLRALTEAIGGRDTEPAVFEGAPGGPRSAGVERALDRLAFSNCVKASGSDGASPSFEIAPRGRYRIGAKWDALSDGARSALSQARAERDAVAPDVLKEGVYVHNKELLEEGARDAALPTGGRGESLAAEAAPAAPDGAEEARRQWYVERGDRLCGEGRHGEAYANYRLAARLRAPDAGLHLKMALTMNEMKLYKDALRHCRAAIRADPAGAAGYLGAGYCLDKLGKYAKALSYSRRAVRLDPSNAQAHLLCGTILNKMGRHARALSHYLRATELDPSSVRAHQNASFSLFHLERYEEALQQAKISAEMLPGDPTAHARIVICLSKLGRHKEAVSAGHKAIDAAPDSVDSYLPLVTALSGMGRHEDVLECCRRAAEADPMDPRPHFAMALSLRELGRQEEALPHCEKSVELDPYDTDYRTAMYQLLRELGSLAEALSHCKAVASAKPDSLPALSNMGSLLAETGRHKEALACLRRVLRIDPNQPVPRYNLALTLQTTGRPRKALKEYKRVAKLDPGHTGAHNNMGIILAEQDGADEALAHFDRALELDPGNATVHYNKALSLQRLSRHDEALAHFDRALELDPGNADAHVGRASCLAELGLPDEKIGHYAGEAPGLAMAAGVAAGAAAGVAASYALRRRASVPAVAPSGSRERRVKSLLSEDESEVLEFKSWPASSTKGAAEPGKIEEKIARELCSLVNTKGGDLLIGVGDGGAVEGLAAGGAGRLSRKERDEMLAWMTNVIVEHFGAGHDGRFDRRIVEVNGLDVLHCAVAASKDGPVILKSRLEKRHDFFVRAGSTCRPLGSMEMLEYVGKTWPKWTPRPQPMGHARASGQEAGAAIAAMGGQDAGLKSDGMP